jgi:hypothetical protein
MPTRRIFASLGVLAATVPMGTAAQTPPPEMVPLEYVRVVAAPIFGVQAPPEMLVGSLPEALAAAVPVLADGRVVGSIVYPEWTTAVVALPEPVADVAATVEPRMSAAGWSRFAVPQMRGGFLGSVPSAMQFCRDDGDDALNVLIVENPAGGSYLRLMHSTGHMAGFCRMREQATMMPWPDLIPALDPPPGATVNSSGSTSGGPDEQHTTARVRSGLDAAALLDHYHAQLIRAGWTFVDRGTVGSVAVAAYDVSDGDGARWHGLLTARVTDGGAEALVSLNVRR